MNTLRKDIRRLVNQLVDTDDRRAEMIVAEVVHELLREVLVRLINLRAYRQYERAAAVAVEVQTLLRVGHDADDAVESLDELRTIVTEMSQQTGGARWSGDVVLLDAAIRLIDPEY